MNIKEITYQGSKKRFVKVLKTLIEDNLEEGMIYIEPFGGGMNSFTPIEHSKKIANDINEYNIALWKAVKQYGIDTLMNEWKQYLDILSDSESAKAAALYNDMKQDCLTNGGKYPKALLGFVAYSCSFGGAWWNGFAKFNPKKGENYVKEAIRGLIKQAKEAKSMESSDFVNGNYDAMDIPDNAFIYCDPPYASTKKYKDNFDNNGFWGWCRDIINTHNNVKVLVSEYAAPGDFICIWSSTAQDKMGNNTMSKTEKLFVHESQKDKFNLSSLNPTSLSINDIMEMVTKAVSTILENREDELMAFHGTTADFDKFDHSFMGTGESTQAYGWGTYVSDCKGTGEYYAMRIANKRIPAKERNANPEMKMNGIIGKVMKEVGNAIRTGRIPFEQGKEEIINRLQGRISPEYIEQYKVASNYDELEAVGVAQRKKALQGVNKILYHVEIPDDNGHNYIDWFSEDQDLMRSIYQKYVETMGKEIKNPKTDYFGHFYQSLCKPGFSDKQISLFLNNLGYVGFRYPIGGHHMDANGNRGDGRGNNYTIFNENDLKIIEKERF